MRAANTIARLVEDALRRYPVPASQIVNQVAGNQLAPATSTTPGVITSADYGKLGDYPDVSSLTPGAVLRATAADVIAFGAADLADSDAVTGLLSPANGGTGTANTGNLAWASGGGTAALRNTGNAASGRLTYWTDDNTVGGDSTLRWNAGELIFGDQTNAPNYGNGNFHIAGSAGTFNIWDRLIGSTFPASPTAGQRWAWYAQSALLRLFTGSGDVFQIGSAGELNVMSYVEMQEITAPATPAANKARVFLRDNGGTTELCAIGNSGTIHVIKALT